MSWQSIADHWDEFRGILRERWGRLSDDDLDAADGRRETLLRILAERYGLRAQEAEALLLEWQKDVAETTPTLVMWRPPARRGAGRSH